MQDFMQEKTKFCNHSETVDAFYRGAFYLVQPKNQGYRAGLDAMLLAALVPASFCGKVADLGAGAGAAGFGVAAHCPKAHITLVERSEIMAAYAHKSKALAQNSAFKSRIEIIQADVTLKGQELEKKGLLANSFDFIIMNPPFNEAGQNISPDLLRAQAHTMPKLLFEQWIHTAAILLKAKAYLALIARPSSLDEILKALHKKFGQIEITPILPEPHKNALRILIRAKHNSRAALTIKPPLILRDGPTASLNEKSDRICNGLETL